jgi:hypothetical protein
MTSLGFRGAAGATPRPPPRWCQRTWGKMRVMADHDDDGSALEPTSPETYDATWRRLKTTGIARRRAEREARPDHAAPGLFRVSISTDETSWQPSVRTLARLANTLGSTVGVQFPFVFVGPEDDMPGSLNVELYVEAEEYAQAELRALSAVRDALVAVGAAEEADWPTLLYEGVEAHPHEPGRGDGGAEFRRLSAEQAEWATAVLLLSEDGSAE